MATDASINTAATLGGQAPGGMVSIISTHASNVVVIDKNAWYIIGTMPSQTVLTLLQQSDHIKQLSDSIASATVKEARRTDHRIVACQV